MTDKTNKRILFVTPPYHCGVVEVAGRWIPLHFAYLAGAAREAGWEPEIYDAMTKDVGLDEIRKAIKNYDPAVVATSAITSTLNDSLKIMELSKELNPEIINMLGGVHPTFMYEEIFNSNGGKIDYIVRGEGEVTLEELLKALDEGTDLRDVKGIAFTDEGEIIATEKRPFIEDLDTLKPAFDIIDWKDYHYFVIPRSRLGAVSTSRGCEHECTFCSQQKFWEKTNRGRDPHKCADEIERLYREYGVNVVLITDEYPTGDPVRWETFLDDMIVRNLDVYLLMETRVEDIVRDKAILWKYRKAGIIHIYIGVEASDQKTLDLIKKDLKVEQSVEAINLIHEHDMITETSFVLGLPDDTKAGIKRTLHQSKLMNPDFAHYLALAPWPYADIYDDVKDHIAIFDYEKYNLIDPVIKPKRLTLEEVDKAIVDCYRKFYMGKLTEIAKMKDPFKRKYLLRSMKLIMGSSFLKKKIGTLGKIPVEVEKLLSRLDISSEIEEKPE